jgi:hypothetical protein
LRDINWQIGPSLETNGSLDATFRINNESSGDGASMDRALAQIGAKRDLAHLSVDFDRVSTSNSGDARGGGAVVSSPRHLPVSEGDRSISDNNRESFPDDFEI